MTTERFDGVIADAGPLIHLHELGCLDLLEDFPRVWVPEAVWREIETHRPGALICPILEQRHPEAVDPRVDTLSLTFTLHRGERQALALLVGHPEAMFITDDTAARLAAQTLTSRVHGTVGLIVRAMRRGRRDRHEVIRLLRAIPDRSTLHIKPALLDEVIAQVEVT